MFCLIVQSLFSGGVNVKLKRQDKSFKFMFGVLDSKTHQTIAYKKNLSIDEFESCIKEMKKKLF